MSEPDDFGELGQQFLEANARETARSIVEACGRDREALEQAIARLALAGLRCGVEAYQRGLS